MEETGVVLVRKQADPGNAYTVCKSVTVTGVTRFLYLHAQQTLHRFISPLILPQTSISPLILPRRSISPLILPQRSMSPLILPRRSISPTDINRPAPLPASRMVQRLALKLVTQVAHLLKLSSIHVSSASPSGAQPSSRHATPLAKPPSVRILLLSHTPLCFTPSP